MKKMILVSAVAGLVTACNVKTPEVKTPDLPDYDKMIQNALEVCRTKESEQPKVSSGVLNSKIVVEDEIATKDIESVDCDGKVIKTERGPERNLSKIALLPAPQGLNEKVQFISIGNARTCAAHYVDAKDGQMAPDSVSLPDGKVIEIPSAFSTAERSGKMKVLLSDSKYKLGFHLNVHDGLNVLKIKYYGKCLKPVDKPNEKLSKDSYLNCKEAKEIASQDVVLDVKVKRPELNEKKQVQVCEKKK